MENAVLTYKEALQITGSKYLLAKAVADKSLFKLTRGLYSTIQHPNPLVVACVNYPEGIITMDSALYEYNLTDVIPDDIHIATERGATRITQSGYRQYFIENDLLEAGVKKIEKPDGIIRVYNRERLLVEVMRKQASFPLDYYKEVINSYRRIIEDLDLRLVEDYMALFKRNEYMFDILQREVL